MDMSRPTEAEAALERLLPDTEVGFLAAQAVIEHLRRYGPNARVAIVGRSYEALRLHALEGPHGLFTLFGGDFGAPNPHLTQFNHEGGGQVQQFSTVDGTSRLQGQIFTFVWAEFSENMDVFDQKLEKAARSQLRTNDFVRSSAGIVQK